MSAIELILSGLFLLFLGLSFRISNIASLDQKICLKVHYFLKPQPWISVFRFLWPFGMTLVALGVIVALIFINPIQGISSAIAFLFFAGIDRSIKILFQRRRPFELQPGTMMLQPHKPSDPSFPSGDTFHIWFVMLTLTQIFHLPILLIVGCALLAILVSLGRIALGVHFPLDIIAGAGIGIAAAGTGTIFNHFLSSGWLTFIINVV